MSPERLVSIGLVFFCAVGICHAQSAGARQAISVDLAERPKPFVSEKGRFLIEFPREPTYDVQQFGPTTIHDFKVSEANAEWRLTYTDFQNEVHDENDLRSAYQAGTMSLQTRPAKLISQTEVRLNGRLGVENLMREGATAYTSRTFLIGRRLYIVTVEQHQGVGRRSVRTVALARVRRFLDSFDFWEVAKPQLTQN
jgi:hypothetical protein